MNSEQIDYVKNELERGVEPEALKGMMKEYGYTNEQVEEIFAAAGGDQGGEESNPSATPIVTAKEEKSGKGWMKGLLIVLSIIIGIAVLAYVVYLAYLRYDISQAKERVSERSIQIDVKNEQLQLALFGEERGTYVGGCEEVEATSVKCVANEEEFQVHAPIGDGTYFCADSAGFSDIVAFEPTATSCAL